MWHILTDRTRHTFCMNIPLARVVLIISLYFAFNVIYLFQVFLSFIKHVQPTQPRVSMEISIFQTISKHNACISNLLHQITFIIVKLNQSTKH